MDTFPESLAQRRHVIIVGKHGSVCGYGLHLPKVTSISRQSVLYRFGVWVSPEECRILGYFLIRRHACQARQSIQFETVRWRCSRLEMWTLFHELHAMVSLLSLGNGLVHYGSVAAESPRDSCRHASWVYSACVVTAILTVINTTRVANFAISSSVGM